MACSQPFLRVGGCRGCFYIGGGRSSFILRGGMPPPLTPVRFVHHFTFVSVFGFQPHSFAPVSSWRRMALAVASVSTSCLDT